jgi:hypothetical protein
MMLDYLPLLNMSPTTVQQRFHGFASAATTAAPDLTRRQITEVSFLAKHLPFKAGSLTVSL